MICPESLTESKASDKENPGLWTTRLVVLLPWPSIVSLILHLGMVMKSVRTVVKYTPVRFIC